MMMELNKKKIVVVIVVVLVFGLVLGVVILCIDRVLFVGEQGYGYMENVVYVDDEYYGVLVVGYVDDKVYVDKEYYEFIVEGQE